MASEESGSEAMVHDRRVVSQWVLLGSLGIMGALALGIVVAVVIFYLAPWDRTALAPAEAVNALQYLLTAMLPLFGAWIGAVIAFYFARENFEAATRNTQALLGEINRPGLEAIPASDVMIALAKLTSVRTPQDDALSVANDILPKFQATGLGRIPVMGVNDTGLGVFHDAKLSQFIIGRTKAGAGVGDAKLSDVLGDQEMKKILDASVVYVTAGASLSSVKDDMDKKGKATGTACRDAFVTEGGTNSGKVIGYLSDIDINKKGAFK